jgi:hypothetical protein
MQNVETPNNDTNTIKVMDKLQQKIQKVALQYKMRFYNDMIAFSRKLEKRYGARECREYKAFHWLIGSTPAKNLTLKDLPGNEVRNFIIGCDVVYPMMDTISKRVDGILTKNPVHTGTRRPIAA